MRQIWFGDLHGPPSLIVLVQMLCVTNLPPCLFDHTPPGVFDGQGSGHDFYGTMWNPPSGFVSGMDGDRAGHFNCDYRQA
mmetsp:Transcript_41755/g.83695  ORF Transcript_41755/g.83695 Transcript_41755/m.83695 type:complete len:80 (-) Transcript_41755:212-451(-)